MSKRRKKTNDDFTGWEYLIAFLLVCGLISKASDYISDFKESHKSIIDEKDLLKWGKFILEAIAIIVAFIIIRKVLKKIGWYEKRRVKKEEKKRCRAILAAREKQPSLPVICKKTDFMCKEEEEVNLAFRQFMEKLIDVLITKTHFEFLNSKYQARVVLKQNKKAEMIRPEVIEAGNAYEQARLKLPRTYYSDACNKFAAIEWVKVQFPLFAKNLPDKDIAWARNFFGGTIAKVVGIDEKSALIFTPLYVLYYTGTNQILRLIRYRDVSFAAEIKTEMSTGEVRPFGEIAGKTYRYTNKDGSRDLRYSYFNNPEYIYVYYSKLIIRTILVIAKVDSYGKTITEECARAGNMYATCVNDAYEARMDSLINHEENVSSAQSIPKKTQTVDLDKETNQAHVVTTVQTTTQVQKKVWTNERDENPATDMPVGQKPKSEPHSIMPVPVQEKPVSKRDSSFFVVDGIITGWNRDGNKAVIPEGIATSIGQVFKNRFGLQSIMIPQGITTIHKQAFYGCVDTTQIEIPSSVTSIGESAFEKCTSLKTVELPAGLSTIAPKLFSECRELQRIVIPKGVRKIDEFAFEHCQSLDDILFMEGLETIEAGAFQNCTSLKRIVLPDSVKYIAPMTFRGCDSLEHIVFGKGLKKIAAGCCEGLKNLTSVTFTGESLMIEGNAFRGCTKLAQVLFGNADLQYATNSDGTQEWKLEKIGTSAFEGCEQLQNVAFSEGLHILDNRAFANCRNLKSIKLPSGINTFGEEVFFGCESLTKVEGAEGYSWKTKRRFAGTPWLDSQSEGGFIIVNKQLLEGFTGSDAIIRIPGKIKTIGEEAFAGNRNLTTVFISRGVEQIGARAFANCKNLKLVEVPDSVRWIDDSAFWGANKVVIRCTRGSVASAFRIRNKLLGEYISRQEMESTPSPRVVRQQSEQKPTATNDGIGGLSEEERRMILEMRRKKYLEKQQEKQQEKLQEWRQENQDQRALPPIPPKKPEYRLVEADAGRISLQLLDDNRKITNNIFNLRFKQSEAADNGKAATEYEVFVIDSSNNTVSNVKSIATDLTGDSLVHKVSFTLSSKEQFDKNAAYYVVVRYKGASDEILSKTQYQINIAFASDFDF